MAIFSLVQLLDPATSLADELDEFRQAIKSVYGFQPHTLTDAEIAAKSKELDKFWDTVKSDTARYLPLLRRALIEATNPPFFYYDGSELLLSVSNRRHDQQIALMAIPHCDLRDVEHKAYLFTVFRLAREALDTSEAAFKILEDPSAA
jgi:hypothetical protein